MTRFIIAWLAICYVPAMLHVVRLLWRVTPKDLQSFGVVVILTYMAMEMATAWAVVCGLTLPLAAVAWWLL